LPKTSFKSRHIKLAVFQASSFSSANLIAASCPAGQYLLSCGLNNSQFNTPDLKRSAIPISKTTCNCFDYFGVSCVAWCTNVLINNFEIVTVRGSGVITASCPVGKQVLGCHIDPTGSQVDIWRYWFPSADGTRCTCKDTYGADCVASCASNINNYEVVSVWGSGGVPFSVNCTKPNNQVLGCGSNPKVTSNNEEWRITYAQPGSCLCYDYFGTQCYAICGQIW
jgi:hypothetical protein